MYNCVYIYIPYNSFYSQNVCSVSPCQQFTVAVTCQAPHPTRIYRAAVAAASPRLGLRRQLWGGGDEQYICVLEI